MRFESNLSIDVKAIVGVSILLFISGCGVAEGPAYLRVEGTVLDGRGIPVQGQEVTIKLKPEFLNQTQEAGETTQSVRTDVEGKFSRESSQWVGGLLIVPLAMIVAPVSGLVAAVTPWTFREVNGFLSPVYLMGSTCLPHPTEIAVMIGEQEKGAIFDKDMIRGRLYQGKDVENAKGCTRVYNVGDLKSVADTSRIEQ